MLCLFINFFLHISVKKNTRMPSSGPVVVGQKGNLVKSALALATLVGLNFEELDFGVDAKKAGK